MQVGGFEGSGGEVWRRRRRIDEGGGDVGCFFFVWIGGVSEVWRWGLIEMLWFYVNRIEPAWIPGGHCASCWLCVEDFLGVLQCLCFCLQRYVGYLESQLRSAILAIREIFPACLLYLTLFPVAMLNLNLSLCLPC